MAARERLIVLTGGGTAGHVMPHLALLPLLRDRGWIIVYVGSAGMEREIALGEGLEFKTIAAGKLRRYFSLKNAVDVFRVGLGFVQSLVFFVGRRPHAVFSKGGFVSVPVAAAAWCLGIPVISHESDFTPGLANRIIARFARRILYSFPETGRFLGSVSSECVGLPIRPALFAGDAAKGAALCGFDGGDLVPTILVMGGSQGAQRINEALAAALPELVQTMRVVHLTGKGKLLGFKHPRYKGFEFVSAELKDLLALADFVISRAGGAIFEFLALRRPMLLIPLEAGSRGDQVLNARCFESQGWAQVLPENSLSARGLIEAVGKLVDGAAAMREKQGSFAGRDAARRVVEVIEEIAGKS